MSDEEWVKAAMVDDSIVVELLVRLNQTSPPPPPKSDLPAPPLDWSVRQRRSKPIMLPAKKIASTRASPTTPLSWSGATSHSGGGGTVDGFEESSRPPPKRSGLSRSKVIRTSETTPTKRPRKKKTLAELKEDEVLLLKERRNLKRELAALRSTLEKQRTENESLKKIKLDLLSQPKDERLKTPATDEAISDETQQKLEGSDPVPPILPRSVTGNVPDGFPKPSLSHSCFEVQKEVIDQENSFMLPDLNLPVGEDFSSEVSYGIS